MTEKMSFEQLPKPWQEAIDKEIIDCDGGERPEISNAFRAEHAQHLGECLIPKKPTTKDRDEIGGAYVDFMTGWKAALRYLLTRAEPTTYCPDDEPDYEAFIVKESDLKIKE